MHHGEEESRGQGAQHDNTRIAGGTRQHRKESTLVEHFPRTREIYIHEVVLRTTLQSESVITTFTSEEIGTQERFK